MEIDLFWGPKCPYVVASFVLGHKRRILRTKLEQKRTILMNKRLESPKVHIFDAAFGLLDECGRLHASNSS